MSNRKYVMSGGLAFSEEKDLRKLEAYAKKGWILERFAFLGYYLRKEEPQSIQYNLDYQKEANEEYFELFQAAGWNHVCSAGKEMHIFQAPLGTKPLYTDKESHLEK